MAAVFSARLRGAFLVSVAPRAPKKIFVNHREEITGAE